MMLTSTAWHIVSRPFPVVVVVVIFILDVDVEDFVLVHDAADVSRLWV